MTSLVRSGERIEEGDVCRVGNRDAVFDQRRSTITRRRRSGQPGITPVPERLTQGFEEELHGLPQRALYSCTAKGAVDLGLGQERQLLGRTTTRRPTAGGCRQA